MVRVELTSWLELVAFTFLCEFIGGAGCSHFRCGFHRQIGLCGTNAEGGTLTLPGRV
jgi:hypothetical protein